MSLSKLDSENILVTLDAMKCKLYRTVDKKNLDWVPGLHYKLKNKIEIIIKTCTENLKMLWCCIAECNVGF